MKQHGHHHDAEHHGEHALHGHGHTHGVVDPSIDTTDRGLWALRWSFVGLIVTAAIQVIVVVLSGSVGLLADTIHNFADAATAIPLGIAFWLARRGRSRRFTYGLGRVEDFAGILIILGGAGVLVAVAGFPGPLLGAELRLRESLLAAHRDRVTTTEISLTFSRPTMTGIEHRHAFAGFIPARAEADGDRDPRGGPES